MHVHAATRTAISRVLFTILGLMSTAAAGGFTAATPSTPPPDRGELVLYCSADSVYAKPVLEAFERSSGVKIKPVFDTEATKTFGLVQRLINEKDASKADVFLSSEAMGMIRLSRAGVLGSYTSATAERSINRRLSETGKEASGWPEMLRADDATWYGFARRVRVLVYNTRHIKPEDLPERLADLTDPRFKGKIGIAKPEFGTTRGHFGALLHSAGEESFKAWCAGLKANGVREFDGNMSVVRAVGRGEIHIGFTDTDDVHAGFANDWPIGVVLVSEQLTSTTHDRAPGAGGLLPYPENAMQMPHTVAIVKGAANRANAERFVDFILSPEVDELLSDGDAKTYRTYMPSRLDRSVESPAETPDTPTRNGMPPLDALPFMDLDLEAAASKIDPALRIWSELVR